MQLAMVEQLMTVKVTDDDEVASESWFIDSTCALPTADCQARFNKVVALGTGDLLPFQTSDVICYVQCCIACAHCICSA